jgi:hypothetical protein
MNLSRLRKNIPVETISEEELIDLRARESEENFDFEDIKKYIHVNKKLSNV